jgi:hypothetical protein
MESSENFDAYMQAVGVNAITAKLGSAAKPTVTISVEGDTWTLKTETTFKKTTIQFKLGVEFDEETADGRKMKTTMTLDGNKLTQDQKIDPPGVPSIITREVNGNKMTVICKAKDVVSTRVYVKS